MLVCAYALARKMQSETETSERLFFVMLTIKNSAAQIYERVVSPCRVSLLSVPPASCLRLLHMLMFN